MQITAKNHIVDVRPYKAALRQSCKEFRRQMDADEKSRKDLQIARRVLGSWQYRQHDTLFTYVSMPLEVDTLHIIRTALRHKKRVVVPRCVEGRREMEFYAIRSLEDLEPGTFQVMEPIPERCERVTDYANGLCIVPALSYDHQGYRLGYGGGYYDRFLAKFSGVTLGICYAGCVRKEIVRSKFDQPVGWLITEHYVRRTGK